MKNDQQQAESALPESLSTTGGAGRTILKNSFWLLLAEGTNKAILFLVTLLIARAYAPDEFGIFGYVFSCMTLIALIADFGLVNTTIRELAKNRDTATAYFEAALSLKLLLSATAFAGMIAAAVFLDPAIRLSALLAGVAILLEGMTDYLRVSFRVSGHSHYEVVVKVAGATMVLVLVAGCAILRLPLTYVLAGFCAAHSLNLLLTLRLAGLRLPRTMNAHSIRNLFAESWPVFLGLLCTAVYGQIDLILIKAYRGYAEVGLYQAAYKLLFGFQLLRAVHLALYPRLAVLHAEQNFPEYRRTVRSFLVLSLFCLIPIGILATIFPRHIIGLFFGWNYEAASTALPLLIWGGIISFINTFFSNTLIISGHQKTWLILEFTALAALVMIEVVLIPRLGFYGAAVATFAGEALFFFLVAALFYTHRRLRIIFS